MKLFHRHHYQDAGEIFALVEGHRMSMYGQRIGCKLQSCKCGKERVAVIPWNRWQPVLRIIESQQSTYTSSCGPLRIDGVTPKDTRVIRRAR